MILAKFFAKLYTLNIEGAIAKIFILMSNNSRIGMQRDRTKSFFTEQTYNGSAYRPHIKPFPQHLMMNAQFMVQPSSFINDDIQMQTVRGLCLFKFSESLQERLEILNERHREANLTAEEMAELTGILELDRIFTLLNAKIVAGSV